MTDQGSGPVTGPAEDPLELHPFGELSGEVANQADINCLIAATMTRMRGQFIELYDREHRGLVRFLMNSGADLQLAEDAMQEAFAAAWAKVRSGDWDDIDNPPAWIRAVGLRAYWRRRRGLDLVVPDLSEAPSPAPSPIDLADEAQLVLTELHALPPRERIAMAFEIDGFSCKETGDHLGITEQQVRDLRKKARKALAPRLDKKQKRRRDK